MTGSLALLASSYSTCRTEPLRSRRVTKRNFSSDLRAAVSPFFDAVGMTFRSSPRRIGPDRSTQRTGTIHLPLRASLFRMASSMQVRSISRGAAAKVSTYVFLDLHTRIGVSFFRARESRT